MNVPNRASVLAAVATTAAVMLTFFVVYGLGMPLRAGPSPAVLGAAIAYGIARRPRYRERTHIVLEALLLPLVGLAAAGTGSLFRTNPAEGAVAMTGALTLSLWLRGRNDDMRLVGRAIGFPFVAMLIVPVPLEHGSPVVQGAFVLAAGLVALAFTTALQRSPNEPERSAKRGPVGSGKLSIHTRMALQLLVALALAFTIGLVFFPSHWPWVVLTAFIICGGTRGRTDAMYKGVLRLGGALGGSIVALTIVRFVPTNGPLDAALIFAMLFFGLALRDVNYAFWAATTTAVFALLWGAEPGSGSTLSLLGLRLLCITIGAICGIAATSLVFPLDTRDIVRKRLAGALAAFEQFGESREESEASIAREIRDLASLEPPLVMQRMLARRDEDDPALWIQTARQILARAKTFSGELKPVVVAAREARRAIRENAGTGAALLRVREALESPTSDLCGAGRGARDSQLDPSR